MIQVYTITLDSESSVCVDIDRLTAGVWVAILLTVTGVRDMPPNIMLRRLMDELALVPSSSSDTFKNL